MEQQEFYANDIALLEIAKDVMVQVKVLDIKRAYGKVRYLITPVKGSGELKVEGLKKLHVKQTKTN